MKTKNAYVKKTINKLIAAAVLVAALVVLLILRKNPAVCEWFATHVGRYWIFVFGNAFGVLPFSVYELLLIVAIVGAVTILVMLLVRLFKRRWKKLLSLFLTLTLICLSFGTLYTAVAGMSYNRYAVPVPLYDKNTAAEDFTKEQAVELAKNLVAELNSVYQSLPKDESGAVVTPDRKALDSAIYADAARLTDEYYSSYTPHYKVILNKTIMSELHISGVFFAPTGEANVNGNVTDFELPFTALHELAHGKGVMRESDANMVAGYLTLTSDDPFVKFSGLMRYLGESLALISLYPDSAADYSAVYATVDKGVFAERSRNSAKWNSFHLLADTGEFFNDLYLKLSGQDGTQSYNPPPVLDDSGEKDGDGNVVWIIRDFSPAQSLLIGLYLSGNL